MANKADSSSQPRDAAGGPHRLDAARSLAHRVAEGSGSNLAATLHWMPGARRRDMRTFYAFCRLVDDDADHPDVDAQEKHRRLSLWEAALYGPATGEHAIMPAVRDAFRRHHVDCSLPTRIIEGARRDVEGRRYRTFEELKGYIDCVAVAVGLVSIRIFGCRHPDSERFADALGTALQLTNILRDIGTDYRNGGRVYLPLDTLQQFEYSVGDIAASARLPGFFGVMAQVAGRAEEEFRRARSLISAEDRAALMPARLMGAAYSELLAELRTLNWPVFSAPLKVPWRRRLAALWSVFSGRW